MSFYRDAIPDMNREAEQKLKQLLITTYFYTTKHEKNSRSYMKLIPKSESLNRFSSETIDRFSHESSSAIRNITGELYNIDMMS